jgi:hypothetical protein
VRRIEIELAKAAMAAPASVPHPGPPPDHRDPDFWPKRDAWSAKFKEHRASVEPATKPPAAPPLKRTNPKPDDLSHTLFHHDVHGPHRGHTVNGLASHEWEAAHRYSHDLPRHADGRPWSHEEVGGIVGAPAGADVHITQKEKGGPHRITMRHEGLGIHAVRHLHSSGQPGRYWLENENMGIAKAPAGTGTRVFAKQVHYAHKVGVRSIHTHAAGEAGNRFYNGYYTWPRLGYNADLVGEDGHASDHAKRAATDLNLPHPPKDLHDLMRAPGGSAWWKEHGHQTQAYFDTTPGSSSHRALHHYLHHKDVRTHHEESAP